MNDFLHTGIRDLSKISNESLFLCENGYEIRSLNDRCNIRPDCADQSDERNCSQCKKRSCIQCFLLIFVKRYFIFICITVSITIYHF